jgi:hypothetical protein
VGAALALRSLLTVSRRKLLAEAARRYAAAHLTIAAHVDSLVTEYDMVVPREALLVTEHARISCERGD